ncbi:MAG: TolC family protein, partial [Burkholderiales bacterium]|nr:TolC family protein [Burkholderiales bacterium]
QRRLDLTAARAAALRWQLAGQLRQRWWAVALARESQALARSRLESAQALASTVKARFQKGDLARVDANLAQVEVLSAQSDLIAAEQAKQEAEAQFRALTAEVAPAVLSPELLTSSPSPTWDGPSHPLLLQAQATVNWAQSRLAVVQASRRDAPEVALRLTNERADAFEPYHQAVGVKVTVPLASDARSRQDGAEVRADLNQAEAEQALIQRQVQQEYVQAYQAWQLAQQQLALAQTRQSLSEDNGRLAQRAFDLGEADLPSLLRARTLQREADVAVKQQQVALELAVSRLLQAQGVLP